MAFVLHNLDSGGAQRVVSTLANEFSKTYDVYIITLIRSEPFYPLDDKVQRLCCSDRSLISKNIFHALRNNVYLYRTLRHLLKEHNISVTIGFTTTANVLAVLASRSLRIPSIISERANPNIYSPNRLWRILRQYSYKNANYLVLQSQLIQEYFKDYMAADRLKILPNPLSTELAAHRNLDSPKSNIILSVGRLDKNKAQDLLIKAFGNVDNEDWKIVFVGDGEEKQNYIDLVHRLNLDTKVRFAGKSTEIYNYYNNAKIFAFTSQSEGFPNVLIEAMYFGLPCISTDCPTGPSEIIHDGETGYLIPVNDQQALEHKLSILMSSETLCKDIGTKGQLSSEKYKTDKVIAQWDELIIDSINNK